MNEIDDISCLADLIKLKTLWLFENQISDITVLADLTDLKELWLEDNPLDLDDLATKAILDTLSSRGVEIDIEW